jgi:hypothetical protein
VYDVQYMREDTILSLESTARYRPENPYRQAGSGAGGKLRHPIWQKPSFGPRIGTNQSNQPDKSLAVGTQLFSKIEWQSQHRSHDRSTLQEQSAAPALCSVFALSESPVDRMEPSPLDITPGARHPVDCRRSEMRIVLQTKTLSGNTAIRRQNMCIYIG